MSSNIIVPELGESIVDARVAKWLKKEGDPVAAGEPLVELETDKIDVQVGAPQAGVLAKIERREGSDVKIGEVLGVVDAAAPADSAGRQSDSPGPKSGPTHERVLGPAHEPVAGPNFSSATREPHRAVDSLGAQARSAATGRFAIGRGVRRRRSRRARRRP